MGCHRPTVICLRGRPPQGRGHGGRMLKRRIKVVVDWGISIKGWRGQYGMRLAGQYPSDCPFEVIKLHGQL